jgi:bifunctional UDP-N-acetylglucosamine pyrophosphorylase / glucosamine-1-phosphate N-acetyltransferase
VSESLHVVILAAGQGKRMHSSLPKVLHPVLFRPMLHHVLDLAKAFNPETLTVVVGHEEAKVRESCSGYSGVSFALQREQKGTGHALQQAMGPLQGKGGRLLVLCGDVCLLTRQTIERLLVAQSDASVLFATVAEPKGYGRIQRGSDGRFLRIVEEADCSAEERLIREVNSGVYVFDLPLLAETLPRLSNQNRQGEFYLTDVLGLLNRGSVELVELSDENEMRGVNDRVGLSYAERTLRDRTNLELMVRGITLQDPLSTWIDPRSTIAPDVVIEAGVRIHASTIETGCHIEAGSRVARCSLGPGVWIKQGSYLENSSVGQGSIVGPYAHLRPGSQLGQNVKIGNFVEVKQSVFGDGSKASHLSYIGDAEIGSDVNLGCGFITCNFDGSPKKNRTIIEDSVFVGSDTQVVAPIRVGKGSYIAAGSTVTEEVPPDSLVLSRGRQITKPGYATNYRKNLPSEN